MNLGKLPLRMLILIGLGGLILSSAAFYNGYPFVYPDTHAYIGMAIKGSKPWARSVFYSYIIYPFHLETTLWPVILMQGVLVAHLVYLALRTTIGRVGNFLFLGVIVSLTAFTSLPWITGYIIPDIFTGVVVLTMYLLGFVRDRLSDKEGSYVLVLCAVAIATHHSHIPLALWITLVIFALRSFYDRELKATIITIVPVACAVVVALVATIAVNIKHHGLSRATGYGQIFALARFIDDGPAYEYLKEKCPQKNTLCATTLINCLSHPGLFYGEKKAPCDMRVDPIRSRMKPPRLFVDQFSPDLWNILKILRG